MLARSNPYAFESNADSFDNRSLGTDQSRLMRMTTGDGRQVTIDYLCDMAGAAWPEVTSNTVPSAPTFPTFPTFSQFCRHFQNNPTFFRQPFLEDGYGRILTKKCVILNVKMLKGFCIPCLRSSISFLNFIENILVP